MNQGSGLTPAWPELRAFLRKGGREVRKRSDVHASSLLGVYSVPATQATLGSRPQVGLQPGEKERSKTGLLVRGKVGDKW